LPFGSASSSLAEGTKILMIKLHFTFDKTKKAQDLKKKILLTYKNHSAKKANIIVVGGGDGYMLSSLKKYVNFEKPFYGINCGTYGFLMNSYSSGDLEKKITLAKKIYIKPLYVQAKTNKFIKKILAINEVSLFRQSRQTASISIKIDNKVILKKLIGDGILVSTPAGSTAYNLSVDGPVMSLNSKNLALTPISPFRPRRWKGRLVSNKKKIKIINKDPLKRPLAAVADNIEIRNIKSIDIRISKEITFCLLYKKNTSLTKKIKLEQKRQNIIR
jgi:NAD+ kinase